MIRRMDFFVLASSLLLFSLVYPPMLRSDEGDAAKIDRHAARKAMKEALGKQVNWKFKELPLGEVVEALRKELKISLHLDRRPLEELGITSDSPVTFEMSGVTARSALYLLLRDLDLTTMIHGEILVITTPEMADANLITQTYDVADLVLVEGGEGSDFNTLIDMITKTVKPMTWDEVGGSGSIQSFESPGIHALVISQTDEIHDQIVELFADLRALRRQDIGPKHVPQVGSAPADNNPLPAISSARTAVRASDERIRKALKKTVDVHISQASLSEVAAYLEKECGEKIRIDLPAIAEKDEDGRNQMMFGPSEPRLSAGEVEKKVSEIKISAHFNRVSVATALDFMLLDEGLSWTVLEECLLITSKTNAESHLHKRTYDISDLPSYRTDEGKTVPDYERLIDTIEASIQPNSWGKFDGPGSITSFEAEGIQALAVAQTWQNQEKIVTLLEDLRKQRHTPLSKEELAKLPLRSDRTPNAKKSIRAQRKNVETVEKLPPLEADAARESLVRSNNRFAFDLYAKLRENTKENLFFSPYGIASVLAMAHAGARGETADEMAKTLSFSLKQDEIPGAYRSLLGATLHPDRPGCELNVANRFWCQQGYRFRQPFLDALHDQFQSGITEVDFRQSDAVTKEMNDWIDEKTKHRIQDAVHPGAINSETRFSIVNAVYFKGKWEESFPKQDTKDMPFFAEREQIQVPMMVLGESSNRYADIDNVQILEKSYLGGDVSMLILLPRKNIKTLDQLESTLTEEKLVEWNKSLQDRDVDVFLPRFTMSTEYQLPGVLGKMGMKKAFLLASADFSGMTETREPLALDQILHKTFLKIDEEGTEAVAVTVVGGMGGMTPVKKTPIFRADHPFLFMIRDTRTGCILFMGRVMNPPVEKGASEKQGMGMY